MIPIVTRLKRLIRTMARKALKEDFTSLSGQAAVDFLDWYVIGYRTRMLREDGWETDNVAGENTQSVLVKSLATLYASQVDTRHTISHYLREVNSPVYTRTILYRYYYDMNGGCYKFDCLPEDIKDYVAQFPKSDDTQEYKKATDVLSDKLAELILPAVWTVLDYANKQLELKDYLKIFGPYLKMWED